MQAPNRGSPEVKTNLAQESGLKTEEQISPIKQQGAAVITAAAQPTTGRTTEQGKLADTFLPQSLKESIKNGISSFCAVISDAFKACGLIKAKEPELSYKDTPLSKDASMVINLMSSGNKAVIDTFDKLDDKQKLKVLLAITPSLSQPEPNIILEVVTDKSNPVGKAFASMCENAQLGDNLNFIRDCRDHELTRNPSLDKLKDTYLKDDVNLTSKEKENLQKGDVTQAKTSVISLLIKGVTEPRLTLSLEKREAISEELKSSVKEYGALGSNDIDNSLFKPKGMPGASKAEEHTDIF